MNDLQNFELVVSQPEKVSGDIFVEAPAPTWTLTDLATYVNKLARLRAVEGWLIGAALNFAKGKHQADRDFVAWLGANVPFSRATAYRLMRLAKRLSLEECQGRPLQYVYEVIEHQIAEDKETKRLASMSTVVEASVKGQLPTGKPTGTTKVRTKRTAPAASAYTSSVGDKGMATAGPLPASEWSVEDEPETEIDVTLEKFQHSLVDLVVPSLSKHQRNVLVINLSTLKDRIETLLTLLSA